METNMFNLECKDQKWQSVHNTLRLMWVDLSIILALEEYSKETLLDELKTHSDLIKLVKAEIKLVKGKSNDTIT